LGVHKDLQAPRCGSDSGSKISKVTGLG